MSAHQDKMTGQSDVDETEQAKSFSVALTLKVVETEHAVIISGTC
jgi:hypothetical protein